MENSIEKIYSLFGKVTIRISAQLYLKNFYTSFSFVQKGGVYLEDGIEHIAMEKAIQFTPQYNKIYTTPLLIGYLKIIR